MESDGDSPGPLPTEEIARRKTNETERPGNVTRRLTDQSLGSFTSESSVTSDPNRSVDVGDLRFLNDDDMPDGQSSILGRGAFAMVRLARRRRPIPQRSVSMISGISCSSDHIIEPDKSFTSSMHSSSRGSTSSEIKDEGVLVAVKIFEKSLLEKCRTVERDSENQIQVRTALDNVELEIAVMKMIQHPNLVSLYEVIDTGSNRLFMVIEYLPLGEIMTNVKGTGMYKRRPRRKGELKLQGVTPEGYFDEHHAALYFVDIMHGLAHLHKNHIAHRDLKPENILLDSRGIAKIGDFGVAHLFEDEMKSTGRSSLDHHLSSNEASSSAWISRTESEYALGMESMSDMGKLTKTEGTWCFWSPEMCAENSLVFSGYACDIYAAGVCLYIFATGKLPFYSEIPLVLFDMIAAADIKLDDLKLSDGLKDVLRKVLTKDPSTRAGVGDCLKHPFCKDAAEQRIRELGDEVEKHDVVHAQRKDLQQAFSSTKRNSLRNMTRRMSGQFLSWKKPQNSMSMSSDDTDESINTAKGAARKKRHTLPLFLARRSQNTMRMDDEDEDESGTTNTRKRGLAKFWRSNW